MGRKITALRLQLRDDRTVLRTISKTLRGTAFTLQGRQVDHPGATRSERKEVVLHLIQQTLKHTQRAPQAELDLPDRRQ